MWGQVQVPISLNCSIGISGEGMLGRRWLVCLLYMCGLTLMCHWSPSFCQARMPSYLMRIIVLTCSQFFFFLFFFTHGARTENLLLVRLPLEPAGFIHA